jgi:hypothetical protein
LFEGDAFPAADEFGAVVLEDVCHFERCMSHLPSLEIKGRGSYDVEKMSMYMLRGKVWMCRYTCISAPRPC